MSPARAVHCTGAPRDLGLDQGQALAAHIRESLGGAPTQGARLRELLPGSRSARAWRDLGAYFPHHAERTLGLSLGARVPTRVLATKLDDLLAGDGGLAAAFSRERAPAALLGRSLGFDASDWVVRHSAPDNDYRTVELAPAWSVAAAIGVNEHGLAATASALPAREVLLRGCAAPAQLLVQDVLQRFDGVDKALEWALRRPAGGCASLLLADASGRVAGVTIEGRQRRLRVEADGFLSGLGPEAALALLEKGAAERSRVDAVALAGLLSEVSGGPHGVAVADPVGHRLGVARGGAALEWHACEG